MTEYFDTHCHIQTHHFDADRSAVIARAQDASVRLLTIGTTLESSQRCVALANEYENVYAAVGVHPNDAHEVSNPELEALVDLARSSDRVLAIGETGLDYYHEHAPRARQVEVFEWHLQLAAELRLPVILHARESAADVLDQVEPFVASGGRAVWHCFVAGKKLLPKLLAQALEMGLYLGMSGLVTFEDQKPLRKIITQIPDAHLLLDTDAPYLIPRPRTMERNEPIGCVRICEELAHLRGVAPEDMARITTRNACSFLGLPAPEAARNPLAYPIRDSLYLGLTNACTNDCTFCARNQGYVVKGHDIRLDHEPDAEEVIAAIGDPSPYKEIVFCGYGEPTMRLDVLKAVARWLKARGTQVRLNTNGLANLYWKRDIAPELAGLVDHISISLNTADPVAYQRLCRSRFGEASHAGMLAFAQACMRAGIETTLSVVDMPGIDVDAARKTAENIGAQFRVRSFVDAG